MRAHHLKRETYKSDIVRIAAQLQLSVRDWYKDAGLVRGVMRTAYVVKNCVAAIDKVET